MQKSKAEQPAFPFTPTQDRHQHTPGMSLRDYFASQAMSGMMPKMGTPIYNKIAESSYEMADAMLMARE